MATLSDFDKVYEVHKENLEDLTAMMNQIYRDSRNRIISQGEVDTRGMFVESIAKVILQMRKTHLELEKTRGFARHVFKPK